MRNLDTIKKRFISVLLATGLAVFSCQVFAADDFSQWLDELRKEAQLKGISTQTLDEALTGLQPIDRVVELDRRQPEFTTTFWDYINARITSGRIAKGREMLKKHRVKLAAMEKEFGVPARYLVAFWGLETNYGSYLGKFSTVGSLATLAYDPRRSKFFRSQLLAALRIIDQGHVSANDMLGSWAGAVGHLQFMPATFLRYAKDGDGDRKIDIWRDLDDVFASGGNYLSNIGWKYGELWGREVVLPEGFDLELTGLKGRKALAEWAALGVTKADGRPLSKGEEMGAIVLPQGAEGPAFLVYDNFDVIMDWNRSIHYAIAVGHLADRFIGLEPIRHGRDADNRPLSFENALELQQRLNELGFDVGTPDGVAGSRTRAAVRDYQKSVGLPVDGYPSMSLLERLQQSEI